MNRLNGSCFYLCGSIDRALDNGKNWRKEIKPKLEAFGIKVFDPLNKNIEIDYETEEARQYRKALKKEGKYAEFSDIMRKVRITDLRYVDKSDCIIVYLDIDQHPCGTYEEIFLANRQKKPIIIMAANGIKNIPDWLWGTIPNKLFFESWEDILNYLNSIDKDDKIDDLRGRWTFFNN